MENFMENEIIENSDEIDTEDTDMQDEDQVVDEVEDTEMEADEIEPEAEVEVDPISELIGSIEAKDYVSANSTFNDILGQRLQDALEAEKVAIADTLYNDTPPDTTDEISDEDIEDTEEDNTAQYEEESVAAA
tara:strand:- start:911 stop:1309 length:399 start_codon:yes stop_codon:yes gene_type:complete